MGGYTAGQSRIDVQHFNMSRNVIEGMRLRRFGPIVNISSINGRKGCCCESGRRGPPADVGRTAGFLASDEAACVPRRHE